MVETLLADTHFINGDNVSMRAKFIVGQILVVLTSFCVMNCPAQGRQVPRPLSEKSLSDLIGLQIDEAAIVAKVKQEGIAFTPEASIIDRLKKAGASDTLLDAVRTASSPSKLAIQVIHQPAITYQDVLKLLELGLDEPTILKRLIASPTHFTLDATQIAELKRAHASGAVLAAMRGGGKPARAGSLRLTDFAIVLDCSGSMGEKTTDGQSKMVEAKRVVSELVTRLPESLRVALIVYGYDRDLNCQAVKVARSLALLDASGKSDLSAQVAALQPVGGTPIASALELAGSELARNDSPCGMVLISDGKETCNGDPAGVAASLVSRLKLSFGLHVVGFDVQGDERASLAAIAQAGRGRYFNAQNVAELNMAIDGLGRDLEIQSKPAETAFKIGVGKARLVKILASTIELPPLDRVFVTPVGTDRMALGVQNVGRATAYGQVVRIAPSERAECFDVWWSPAKGRSVRMAKALPMTEPSTEIQPADYLGLVRVTGTNLPRSEAIMLTPPGTESFAVRASSIQSIDRYGKDMALPPGFYDLWIEPAVGGRAERVVEKLEVVAGKVTVID
jgi:Mg-chelatase subunit ChlD